MELEKNKTPKALQRGPKAGRRARSKVFAKKVAKRRSFKPGFVRVALTKPLFESLKSATASVNPVEISRTGRKEIIDDALKVLRVIVTDVSRLEKTGTETVSSSVKLAGKSYRLALTRADETNERKPASDPFAAARHRGATKVVKILEGSDMLGADEFAKLIGVTRETVHQKRRRFEILGLEGATRAVKFPVWQLTDDGRLLPGLHELANALGNQPWAIYRFLLKGHAELDGMTGLEALKTNRRDQAVAIANATGRGDFS